MDETLFNYNFPNWGEEGIYVILKNNNNKIGEGEILSKNTNGLTLSDDNSPFGVKDYPWNTFTTIERIILGTGVGA